MEKAFTRLAEGLRSLLHTLTITVSPLSRLPPEPPAPGDLLPNQAGDSRHAVHTSGTPTDFTFPEQIICHTLVKLPD